MPNSGGSESWTCGWDRICFTDFLSKTLADIERRIKAPASLDAVNAVKDEAKEFAEFVNRLQEIRGPHSNLKNVDMLIDPLLEVKWIAHGSFRAYYVLMSTERLCYGALVVRGIEADLAGRLSEIIARATPPLSPREGEG